MTKENTNRAQAILNHVVLIIIVIVCMRSLFFLLSFLMMSVPVVDVWSDYWAFGVTAILALFGGIVIGIKTKKKAILISLITAIIATIVYFLPLLLGEPSISYTNIKVMSIYLLCIVSPMVIGSLYGFFKR